MPLLLFEMSTKTKSGKKSARNAAPLLHDGKKTTKKASSRSACAKETIPIGTRYTGTKNADRMKIEDNFEAPECHYKISAKDLINVLQENGMLDGGYNILASLLTDLRVHEDYSVLRKPPRKTRGNPEEVFDEHQTPPPFKEKIVNALFWIPGAERYKYLRVRLAPSNIKAAGIGAYAVDEIPKGARGVYKGVSKRETETNMYYSWIVKSYDAETGETDEEDRPMYYIDATDLDTSNWTRYVNCGMTNKVNNFDSDQLYDKFFYVATKNIKPDEELFIDYGNEYREDNLGMKGAY